MGFASAVGLGRSYLYDGCGCAFDRIPVGWGLHLQLVGGAILYRMVAVRGRSYASWLEFATAVRLGRSCSHDDCGARDRVPVDWDLHLQLIRGTAVCMMVAARAMVFPSVGICIGNWFGAQMFI